MDSLPPSPFTESEREELAQVSSRLRAQGRGGRHSIEHLLWTWTRFAESVGASRAIPDEFSEYLMRRDALERALGECPAPLVHKLKALIDAADEKYQEATKEDGGRSLAKWCSVGNSWWWLRRPFTGPLSEYLDRL